MGQELLPQINPILFHELEYLLVDYAVNNNKKKEYAAWYVSYDTAETWLSLPEFSSHTYAEWKLLSSVYP